jgi:hypothetical protein
MRASRVPQTARKLADAKSGIGAHLRNLRLKTKTLQPWV